MAICYGRRTPILALLVTIACGVSCAGRRAGRSGAADLLRGQACRGHGRHAGNVRWDRPRCRRGTPARLAALRSTIEDLRHRDSRRGDGDGDPRQDEEGPHRVSAWRRRIRHLRRRHEHVRLYAARAQEQPGEGTRERCPGRDQSAQAPRARTPARGRQGVRASGRIGASKLLASKRRTASDRLWPRSVCMADRVSIFVTTTRRRRGSLRRT